MTRALALIWVYLFCLSIVAPLDAQEDLTINIQEDALKIESVNQSLMVYQYAGVPFKPYVQKLFSPSGRNILRDAPEDHLHHHGLMFAVNLNGVSFWAETDVDGKQIHQAFHDVKSGDDNSAKFCETLLWFDPKNKILAHELRTIHVQHLAKHKANVLTWETSLVPASTSAEVGGSHYYGLGMRFIESLDKVGRFFNSDNDQGEIFRGDERLAEADWCAYSATGDFPMTACMLNDPQNSKPATWFTMPSPFSYLSATVRYHEKPFRITQTKPLKLRYAVALWDGIFNNDQIEALYQDWAGQQ